MPKKKRRTAEFRYYTIPDGRTYLTLLGEKWIQTYGAGNDFLHYHNYMEIGYCYQGSGTMLLGEESYSFSGNEITVIPKDYLHTTKSKQGNISRWEYIFVDVETLINKYCTKDSPQSRLVIKRIRQGALFMEEKRDSELVRQLRSIFEIMRGEEEFCYEQGEALLFSFLVSIARINKQKISEPKKDPRIPKRQNHIISQAIDYISDHYSEPLRIEDIAKYVHISEVHLRRIFDTSLRMKPLEYINLVRIQMACNYLDQSDDAVSLVASKCGFSSHSSFNRNFNKVMGMTPAQYRKRPNNYKHQIFHYDIRHKEGW